MKILRIANVVNNRTGGMSRTMYCTGDIMVAMGHEVDYLFYEDFEPAKSSFLQHFNVPLQIPKILDRLYHKHYDVVEIHEPLSAFYGIARRFQKKALPPMVIFSYGIEKRNQIAELNYKKSKGLSLSLQLRYFRITVVQSTIGLLNADHIICSNSEDISYLQQKGISHHRLTQHHSGADPEFFDAGKAIAHSENRLGVLFVGSWIIRKGILDLVAAMTEIMERYPTLPLTIAGCSCLPDLVLKDFPEHLRSRLKVIPKLTSNAELIEIYRQHSIFVISSYFEGQPLVMIEAAAMGLAIITTNICGMADFIQHNVNGMTINVGDVQALIRCLDAVVADPNLARTLGVAARETAQSYTWERAAQKILSAYQQVINDAATKN